MGGQSGERQIQASVVITSVGVSQTINEIVERSFGFQASGGVTHSTVS